VFISGQSGAFATLLLAAHLAWILWVIFGAIWTRNRRWIAFELVASSASNAILYVVAASGGRWVPVTDGKSWDDKPRWSPDGKMLYFMSARTGLLNVWAIRFDDVGSRVIGEPFQVTAFENPGLMMPPQNPSLLQISIAEDRLVLPLAAVSGNIWLLENVD
jgi:hypothetical protein